MPSPFAGMDPFLEKPPIFTDFHDRFLTHLSEALQARLPEPYYAPLGERTWIEVSHRFIEPDVNVLRPAPVPERAGATATLEATRSLPLVVTVPHDERREPFVEIYVGGSEGERLVTTIDLLSPSNKTPGEHGRDLYQRKQQEVLASKVHLVEIDLLRGGEHTTAVPLEGALAVAGSFDYHVCIHRFDRFEDYLLYPIRLEESLPEIAIPLLPGDPDVMLDLQRLFQETYDAGPYRRRLDYSFAGVIPPLRPEQQEWVSRSLAADRAARRAEPA